MTFSKLGLAAPILKALDSVGYEQPTPIQAQAIPPVLAGDDLLASAQTGTGKTAAFAIPIIHNLYQRRQDKSGKRPVKALIVTPTRELALQIDENVKLYAKFTGLRSTVVFGGVKPGKQIAELRRGVDLLVATPGRLLDLLGQSIFDLKQLEFFVLDEADQMLDMGFIHDIRRIIKQLPNKRQSLFFSATLPKGIVELSQKILTNPKRVSIAPEKPTVDKVEQSVYFVEKKEKRSLLVDLLKQRPHDSRLVFSRTKHGSDKIVKMLKKKGIEAAAIHGNKSQNARQKALQAFKDGRVKVLVATDIAARGIDVAELDVVIQYDLPNVAETYVHRIGRTARAGMGGEAVAFCSTDEKPLLRDIQKLIKQELTRKDHDHHPDTEDGQTKTGGDQQATSTTERPAEVQNKNRSGRNRNQSRGRSGNRNSRNRNRKQGRGSGSKNQGSSKS